MPVVFEEIRGEVSNNNSGREAPAVSNEESPDSQPSFRNALRSLAREAWRAARLEAN